MNLLLRAIKKAGYKAIVRLTNKSSDFTGFDKYYLAGAYHWNEIETNCYYRQKAEFICKACNKECETVADFGCGDGALLGFLAVNYPETVFLGIEADRTGAKLAKKMLARRGIRNVTIKRSSFETLQVDTCTADLAYSMDVIEHLPNPTIMLERMAGMIRPNGRAIIGTPLFINSGLISPYHVHEFKAEELKSLI